MELGCQVGVIPRHRGTQPRTIPDHALVATSNIRPARHEYTIMSAVSDLELTAYHEAGHAVAAVMFRRKLVTISIVPNDDNVGRCRYASLRRDFHPDWDTSRKTQGRLEALAMCSLAGYAAASWGAKSRRRGRERCDFDFHNVVNYLSYVHPERRVLDAYIGYLTEATFAKLRAPGPRLAIRELAKELLSKQEVSGQAARITIRRCLTGSRFG